jgi:hypothetical protein
MSMPDNHYERHGRRPGALKLGEALTMCGMVAGQGADPVAAFVLVSLVPCRECGEPHTILVDKSVEPDMALRLLTTAINEIMFQEGRADGWIS